MVEPQNILDGPDELLHRIGAKEFVKLLDKAAETITRNTPIGVDSWDDPEDYEMEGICLAHGWAALRRHLAKAVADGVIDITERQNETT